MKIAFFDAKSYDIKYFDKYNDNRHMITYHKDNLTLANVHLTKGYDAVCAFVNTYGDKPILEALAQNGVKYWLQRSMGYNKVDLQTAQALGIHVFRIFNYSAESIGEFAFGALISLNRNMYIAHDRVRNYNFALQGLEGLCLQQSTIGVIGAGKIGQTFIKLAVASGAKVLVYDEFAMQNNPQLASNMHFTWAALPTLLQQADFISLHVPLLPSTKYLINAAAIAQMKPGVIIINTSRGEVINLTDVLAGLKRQKIRALASDVLEREEGRFYEDWSAKADEIKNQDPEWKELLAMPNVLITSHQAFFTDLALSQIAKKTLTNADNAQQGNFAEALWLQADGTVKNG